MPATSKREHEVLRRCQDAVPAWRGLGHDDFEFSPPRGFSSFTMAVRCRAAVEPPAVLYRALDHKPNALLGHQMERGVYEALDAAGVAAPLIAYADDHRIETFFEGESLVRQDLADHAVLAQIGERLATLHSVEANVPSRPFFELAHATWGPVAQDVLTRQRGVFTADEQEMCEQLMPLVSADTLDRVRRLIPSGPLNFCHNDTYHGNIMRLRTGEIRLLDFEFACLNHPAFDFANLFAETVMRHQLVDYPHFGIAEPEYTDEHIAALVEGYLRSRPNAGTADGLVAATRQMIPLSDYMYAMAATTLAPEPIQKIRFIPYALLRFRRFLDATA